MNYRVVPIPGKIAAEVRRTLVSPQYKSLQGFLSVANDYGPCRNCLSVFDQGKDRRIFFTYNSFEGLSGLPDPGPIFIHENECEPFDGDRFPADLFGLPICLESFGADSRMEERIRMDPKSVDSQITRMFSSKEVRFINIRNAEAGCFIARVERV